MRKISEALDIMEEFAGNQTDEWITIAYIGQVNKYMMAEAMAYGITWKNLI